MEYVLLGLLSAQAQHGYDLHKRLQEDDGLSLIWRVKQAQSYAILEKLEAQGLLESHLVSGEHRPDRRLYSLSPAGRTALESWMRTPVENGRAMRQEFLARLYFARLRGSAAARELVAAQVSACRTWLRHLQAWMEASGKGSYPRLVWQYRLVQAQGFLFWLDVCMKELEETN